MKPREEVSAVKLRGGFYTPTPLVRHCYDRLRELVGDRGGLRLLEPSTGDGAFLRGLAGHDLAARCDHVHGVEIVAREARAARVALAAAGIAGSVEVESAIAWAARTDEWFDAAVGNPPYVRYQFLPEADRALLPDLGERLGVRFRGVGNVWIPVFLGALGRLRPGGAFAFVIPAECFTGVSAGVVRDWLRRSATDLRFDLFPPGSFPGVLQEVTVVSGRAAARTDNRPATINITEHSALGRARRWGYPLAGGERTWTRYLLEPRHLAALSQALDLPSVRDLRDLARLEVSIVTGANDFFCVDDATADAYDLHPWTKPLLPRGRLATGLRYTAQDQHVTRAAGARAWLLDFDPAGPDPTQRAGPARYLQEGQAQRLHERFKCRTREPWFRVPSVRAGELLLSKRSHLHPRLVLNEASSLTTDTIYRGRMQSHAPIAARDLVAAFHGSLTLLSAELEGRSFGGGVLELVPSEVGALAVPAVAGLGRHLPELDRVARTRDPDELVRRTDALLTRAGAPPADLIGPLAEARAALLARRLDRSGPAARPALAA